MGVVFPVLGEATEDRIDNPVHAFDVGENYVLQKEVRGEIERQLD
jgi:hypothetical protein